MEDGDRERETNQRASKLVSILFHRLEVSHCDIWFIRFCVDYHHELLALGNTAGKIFIWDLTSDESTRIR